MASRTSTSSASPARSSRRPAGRSSSLSLAVATPGLRAHCFQGLLEVLYFQFLAFLMMIFAVHLCLQARCGRIL